MCSRRHVPDFSSGNGGKEDTVLGSLLARPLLGEKRPPSQRISIYTHEKANVFVTTHLLVDDILERV